MTSREATFHATCPLHLIQVEIEGTPMETMKCERTIRMDKREIDAFSFSSEVQYVQYTGTSSSSYYFLPRSSIFPLYCFPFASLCWPKH
jgi:hypothetical protein